MTFKLSDLEFVMVRCESTVI